MPRQIKKFEKTLYQVTLLENKFLPGQELCHHVIKRIVYIRDDKVDNLYIGVGVILNSNNLLSVPEHGPIDVYEIGGTDIRYNELILLDKEKFQSSIPASCNNDCN